MYLWIWFRFHARFHCWQCLAKNCNQYSVTMRHKHLLSSMDLMIGVWSRGVIESGHNVLLLLFFGRATALVGVGSRFGLALWRRCQWGGQTATRAGLFPRQSGTPPVCSRLMTAPSSKPLACVSKRTPDVLLARKLMRRSNCFVGRNACFA